MKFLSSFIVFAFSIFLVGQSHAQSSWGTQDTSINWIGFNWRDLGLGGYDTNTDGFGTVVTGLDLGNLDPTLQGLTVDVSVAGPITQPTVAGLLPTEQRFRLPRLGASRLDSVLRNQLRFEEHLSAPFPLVKVRSRRMYPVRSTILNRAGA